MVVPNRHDRKPNGRMDGYIHPPSHAFLSHPFSTTIGKLHEFKMIQNGIWLELYVWSNPAKYAPNEPYCMTPMEQC